MDVLILYESYIAPLLVVSNHRLTTLTPTKRNVTGSPPAQDLGDP